VMQQFFICMVQTMHPLTPDHYTYTPPAFVGAVPALIVLVILLYLAVRNAKTH
jgi:hypothetical protein